MRTGTVPWGPGSSLDCTERMSGPAGRTIDSSERRAASTPVSRKEPTPRARIASTSLLTSGS